MAGICEEAEKCIDNFSLSQSMLNATLNGTGFDPMTTIESLASSAVLTAAKVQAACIVVLASNGFAARLIAKYRPNCPVVVGVVPRARRGAIGFMERELSGHAVARQCLLTRGLIPVLVSPKEDDDDAAAAAKSAVMEAIEHARARGLVRGTQPIVTMYNVERQARHLRDGSMPMGCFVGLASAPLPRQPPAAPYRSRAPWAEPNALGVSLRSALSSASLSARQAPSALLSARPTRRTTRAPRLL